jgi:putative ABC transport system permease protein
MLRLALRMLRFRVGSFVASFIALFFGAATVMACGGLMETGIRLAAAPQRLNAAPIIVAPERGYGNGLITRTLTAKVQSAPGVDRAIPDVSFPAVLLKNGQPLNDSTSLAGHGWASTALAPYTVRSGHAPATGEVALDETLAAKAGVQIGDKLVVVTRGELKQFTAAGIVANGNVSSPALFFADEQARQLSGTPDKLSAIGVLLRPGAEPAVVQQKLGAVLQGQHAATFLGDDRGEVEFGSVQSSQETLIILAGVFTGLVVSVAIFVVGSTLGLLIQQRLREMALLRAIGATPGQLRRMILGETIIVSIVATGLATMLGSYIGKFLLSQLSASGAVAPEIIYKQGPVPLLAGVVIALITTILAALIASRSASTCAQQKPSWKHRCSATGLTGFGSSWSYCALGAPRRLDWLRRWYCQDR